VNGGSARAGGPLGRIVAVRPGELALLLWSFGYFFCLLAAYYMIRPLREEMAVQYGGDRLQHLFSATFLTMVALIPTFGWLASRLPVHRLLPTVYLVFMALLVGFWSVLGGGAERVAVAPFFFVFVSVFNLFVVSVFWSFMADIWSTEASRRLFGFISAGGSLGAITGPLVATGLVRWIGVDSLLLAAAATLGLALACIGALLRRTGARAVLGEVRREDREEGGEGRGGAAAAGEGATARPGLWIGAIRVARSPYLLGIAVFVTCYTVLGTMLYYLQVNMVKAAIADPGERTQLFAALDLAINVLTVLLQLFVTGRLLAKLGATVMLAALPVVSLAGFAALGFATILPVLVTVGVLRRAGEFAITKPTRETLFTVVSKEDKYQAKNVIDTVIHRGGDAASSWFTAGLQSLGLSLSGIATVGVPIAAVWLGTALFLGRRHEVLRQEHERRSPAGDAAGLGPVP
jgi:AAA family ATP:ADP antiporter